MGLCGGIYLVLLMVYVVCIKKRNSLKLYKRTVKKILLFMLCINTLAMALELEAAFGRKVGDEWKVERNGFGEGKKEAIFRMQVEGEKEEEVILQIAPQEYAKQELQKLFRQAMKVLEKEILDENETADHVGKDLHLPDHIAGFPFAVSWELERYDVMDMNGRIKREELRKQDPSGEGLLMRVTAVLHYGEEEALMDTEVKLFADAEKEAGIRERVLEAVQELDRESRERPYLILPEKIDGRKITWKQDAKKTSIPILMLGMIGSILLICQEKQKELQRKKEKEEQMMRDYPEIISQFTMLMGAGMTAKNVWKKVAEDYRKQCAGGGKKRYAYEEILYTWQEMQGGIPETECYERFAGRCELLPYMKLGVLLSQNLKKGSRGLSQLLRMESVQAMEERKSRARRLGEEAGTRLLMPMLLMLIIVLMIVVVPAFLSIQL